MANIALVFHSGYGHTLRMAQSPSDSSSEEMLPGDLETAKRFGKPVAAVATSIRS
jgi:hypothetical protein